MHTILRFFVRLLIILAALFLIVLGLGTYKFNYSNRDIHMVNNATGTNNFSPQINAYDHVYNIENQLITLVNGIESKNFPNEDRLNQVTKYWGGDLRGDFDNNGTEDVVFILTQERGDGKILYYVTALMNKTVTIPAILLGDRIAPQTINLEKNNIIAVNYADRGRGEPFTVSPSFAKTLRLKIDLQTMSFGIVVNNFEGEANPSKMELTMKTWNWEKIVYNNDTEIVPRTNRFTLTLKKDKTFSAKTDCNGIGGEYSVIGKKIKFDKMMSTLMYCEGSQEQEFSKALSEAEGFFFTSKGELVITLKTDSGSIIFK